MTTSTAPSLAKLPREILGHIASFTNDTSLCSLNLTSKLFQEVALCEISSRELKATQLQLKKIEHLSNEDTPGSSYHLPLIDSYKQYVTVLIRKNLLPPDQKALKQDLLQIATHDVVAEIAKATADLHRSFEKNAGSVDSLRKKIFDVKSKIIHQACETLIRFSLDQQLARTRAVDCFFFRYRIVNLLIQNGPISHEELQKVFNHAARSGNVEMLKTILLKQDVKPDDVGTALVEAARQGQLEIAQTLFKERAIPKSFAGKALIDPVREGYHDLIELILAKGAVSNKDRGVALQFALEEGKLDIVKKLLASGPLTPATTKNAVEYASHLGLHKIIQEILKSGSISDESRKKSLDCAFVKAKNHPDETKYIETLKVLLSTGVLSKFNLNTFLIDATCLVDVEILKALLQKGSIEVGSRGSALKNATKKCHQQAVKILLENGPIDETTKIEAMFIASENDRFDILLDILRS